MAFDAFLKLDGIKGESADSKHRGEIDIVSFNMGLKQTGTHATGGGGGVGRVAVQDMQFVKKVDSASPLLLLHCASGAHIKEANFVVRKAGGQPIEYLKIKLTDVLVSNFEPHGKADQMVTPIATHGGQIVVTGRDQIVAGDEIPMEDLSLNFAKIEFSYQPQGADGRAQGGPIVAGWDVKANKKI